MTTPGIDRLGQGFMQGMQMGRQWNQQDAEQERQQRLMEMREQEHGLNIEQSRNEMDHRANMRPLEVRQGEQKLERGDQQLQMGDLKMRATEMELDEAELDQVMQQAQREAPTALRALEQGNLEAVEGFMDEYMPYFGGSQVMFEQGEDGELIALTETEDGGFGERPTSVEEIAQNIRHMGQMEEPERYGDPFEMGGGLYQQGPDGQLVPVDGMGPGDMGQGGAGVESADRSLVERIGRNFFGQFNPDGSFGGFMDESAQESYLLGQRRAEELMTLGLQPAAAAEIGMMSARQDQSDEELLREAERLAAEEHGKSIMGIGGASDDQVDEIFQQLKAESQQAEQRYNQLIEQGGGQQGMVVPGGQQGAPRQQGAQGGGVRLTGGGQQGGAPQQQGMQTGQGGGQQTPSGAGSGQPLPDIAGQGAEDLYDAERQGGLVNMAREAPEQAINWMRDTSDTLSATGQLWRGMTREGFDQTEFTRGRPGGETETVATGKDVRQGVQQGARRWAQGTYGNLRGVAGGIKRGLIGEPGEAPEGVRQFVAALEQNRQPSLADLRLAMQAYRDNPESFSPELEQHLDHWIKQYARNRGQ